MQKNLLLAIAGAVCVSFLSSCGTESKKDEAVKTEQAAEQKPVDAPTEEAGKEVSQAPTAEGQDASTQVAQTAQAPTDATQTAAAPTEAPTNEQKA